jgi:hypothetical protein
MRSRSASTAASDARGPSSTRAGSPRTNRVSEKRRISAPRRTSAVVTRRLRK